MYLTKINTPPTNKQMQDKYFVKTCDVMVMMIIIIAYKSAHLYGSIASLERVRMYY